MTSLEFPKPVKPFPRYKWRWATLTPTEGLIDPPVFLGVLRALNKHEGQPPSSSALQSTLKTVQNETRSTVELARDTARNLLRNSGQYWKALGVLNSTRPITLSSFGKKVCNGEITQSEFSATVIKTLTLPNARIEDDSDWVRVGLAIKPLELILDIVVNLYKVFGKEHAYLTTNELIKIVIPLAGIKARLRDYSFTISAFRKGKLNITSWPNCTPGDNDARMAKEFILFLCHYGYLVEDIYRGEKRFRFVDVIPEEFIGLSTVPEPSDSQIDETINIIKESHIADFIDRQRVTREMFERPGQQAFRTAVLKASSSRCAITGVGLEPVLQAAHIIPAAKKGSDDKSNGLCLRSDIHILFDNGSLRVHPTGDIHLSPQVVTEPCYKNLPKKIIIPTYINPKYLEWKNKYT